MDICRKTKRGHYDVNGNTGNGTSAVGGGGAGGGAGGSGAPAGGIVMTNLLPTCSGNIALALNNHVNALSHVCVSVCISLLFLVSLSIYEIFIAALQGNYSEAHPGPGKKEGLQ